MNKKTRNKVWLKFGRHCAYCGKELDYKEMQVDHLIPQRLAHIHKNVYEYENLMPSCRRCNHYKGGGSLKTFRRELQTLHERILKIYINKVGDDYGIISIKPFDGIFYFEKLPLEGKINSISIREASVELGADIVKLVDENFKDLLL